MTETNDKHIILLVEDSPEDYEATIRAFNKAGMKNMFKHCEDGDEALDYLNRRGKYANPEDSPRPSLILLDLNLPGTDGREVLEEIKANPNLRSIPVVVLTTSSDEKDIDMCYASGANSYIQKPVGLDNFMNAIQRLKDYWFQIVLFPRDGSK